MGYRVGSVKKNLKPFKAWLHYGDSAHPPMHTASFHGNQYDLNVLIKMAKAEGEPLRVQKEETSRTATKRKRSYSGRSKTTRTKAKRAHVKRRTLTRLRRRIATKARGYGVLRHGKTRMIASIQDAPVWSKEQQAGYSVPLPTKHVREHYFVGSGTWCDRCGQHIDSPTHDG